MKYTIPVICAWCKKQIGTIENDHPDVESHGLCGECKKKYFPEFDEDEPEEDSDLFWRKR